HGAGDRTWNDRTARDDHLTPLDQMHRTGRNRASRFMEHGCSPDRKPRPESGLFCWRFARPSDRRALRSPPAATSPPRPVPEIEIAAVLVIATLIAAAHMRA